MPYLIEAGIVLVAVVAQIVLSGAVSIIGAVPDLALIYVVWAAFRRGQLFAEVAGFVLGLLVDLLSSSTVGSHSLTYCVIGFLVGYFSDAESAEQRLRNWPFLLFVALSAVVNALLWFVFFALPGGVSFSDYMLGQIGVTVLYTTILAVVPMFYASRRPLY